MADRKLLKREIRFDGKLIEAEEPVIVAENFQTLTNLRYGNYHPQGIGGMTQINQTTLLSSYPKVRSAIHFKKDFPQESHIVVEAWNSSEDAAQIYTNDTAIGNTGDFNTAALYTPATTSPSGRFSLAPNGYMAYANGKEVCLWGGDENPVAAYYVGTSWDSTDNTLVNPVDYTEYVNNTDDSETARVGGGIDDNTLLYLKFDDGAGSSTFDDSSTNNHTITVGGSAVQDATEAKFGVSSYYSSGDSHYLSVSDDHGTNDYWHMSTSPWTIDFFTKLQTAGNGGVISQQVAASTDWVEVCLARSVGGTGTVAFWVRSGGSDDISFQSSSTDIPNTTDWHHVAIVRGWGGDNDKFAIAVNGTAVATHDSTHDWPDMDAPLEIGRRRLGTGTGVYLPHYLDNLRFSTVARWQSNFSPPTRAYTAPYRSIAVGGTLPLKGVKHYIGSGDTNPISAAITSYQWNGYSWQTMSATDDTGGFSSADKWIDFASTEDDTINISKPKYMDGQYLYWYRFDISTGDAEIYYVTTKASFQKLKDLWDGKLRQVSKFLFRDATQDDDWTLHVRDEVYASEDSETYFVYADSDDAVTSADYLVAAFDEPQVGLKMVFPGKYAPGYKFDTTADIQIDYWNGSTFESVTNISDGTRSNSRTLAQSGIITWTYPGRGVEFPKELNGEPPLYYYRLSHSPGGCDTTDHAELYYVAGIPAQAHIGQYDFPFYANDRLWLVQGNEVVCSGVFTAQVFNGEDTWSWEFGDKSKLIGASWIYSQFGSSLYNIILWFKYNETWALVGDNPDNWKSYQLSNSVGCVAPHTIRTIELPPETTSTQTRKITVWQASDGIYMSDGRPPVKISTDIENYFDQRDANKVSSSVISQCAAGWDQYNSCYHWLFGTSSDTNLTTERAFDFTKGAWFQVDRGNTSNDLQYIVEAEDTSGLHYQYGFKDVGRMMYLENGNNMDGEAVAHTMQIGDLALHEGSITRETMIQKLALVMKAKATTSNTITVTHYGDGNDTGTTETLTLAPQKSGYHIAYPIKGINWGPNVFHSLKFQVSSSNETIGFEPIYLAVYYKDVRDYFLEH